MSAVEAKRGADASAQAQLRLTAQQERDVRAIVEQEYVPGRCPDVPLRARSTIH